MVGIQIGDSLLDTDSGTKYSFVFNSRVLTDGKASRSSTISVPATPRNNELLGWDRIAEAGGVRQAMRAAIVCNGRTVSCVLHLLRYSGGRYELAAVIPDVEGLNLDIKLSEVGAFADDVLLVRKGTAAATHGDIPNFGWYSYHNGNTHGGSVVNVPLTQAPVASMGYIIDQALAAVGGTIGYEGVVSAWDLAMVLPSVNAVEAHEVQLTGSGHGGWTLTGGVSAWADAGLVQVGRQYKCGWAHQNKTVFTLQAIRPVRIEIAAGAGVVACTNKGFTMLTPAATDVGYYPTDQAYNIELATGESFTFGAVAELNMAVSPVRWRSDAWEDTITMGFRVTENGEQANEGQQLRLVDNLPDMTLRELLRAYMDITGQVCRAGGPDDTFITMYDWDNWDSGTKEMDLNGCKIAGVRSLGRYIDGYAQDNVYATKEQKDVRAEARYMRHVHCANANLDAVREVRAIPFVSGDWLQLSNGDKQLWLTDSESDGEVVKVSGGACAVGYRSAVQGVGLLHLQTLLDRGLVGTAVDEWARFATTIQLEALMPLGDFLTLRGEQPLMYGGRRWLCKTGRWSDGAATLELITY